MDANATLISDFTSPLFREAFQAYFRELGIHVSDWDGLFREMNEEQSNLAYLLSGKDGGVIGFIQFQLTSFTNWFFEEDVGFIREFWINPACRRLGHGTTLLDMAERYFVGHGAYRAVLTADDAVGFYLGKGYQKTPGMKAKNRLEVLTKGLPFRACGR